MAKVYLCSSNRYRTQITSLFDISEKNCGARWVSQIRASARSGGEANNAVRLFFFFK